METATQKYRQLEVATPLGPDVLLLHRMTATERLGGLFEYQLDLLSTKAALPPKDLLGQSMTVRVGEESGPHRYFNGLVTSFGQFGTLGRYAYYRATLSPWLWFLTRTTDCRIFQDKTAPEIIDQIFSDYNFSSLRKNNLSASYPKREYCVQYRETAFNFVSRLMEEEGIYYYFEHENGKHTLVLADSHGAHGPIPGYAEIPYFEPGNIHQRERPNIHEWSFIQQIQPNSCVLTDYDFKSPSTDLEVRATTPSRHPNDIYEWYDSPGLYQQSGDGTHYVNCRVEEFQAQFETARGSTNLRALCTGFSFKLKDYPRQDRNNEYLVTSAWYQAQSDEFISSDTGGVEELFQCSFTAIEKSQVFRAPRTTPKPVIHGPQTAVVVGKEGEEIDTDQYGRVKVRFFWDRYAKNDQNASCWIRVAQLWAGKKWGAMFLPRRGQEVIVDFLEGDPDRPIITGRVYNDEQMPPYALPDYKTKSTLKSDSSKGGGGFNEIRFEDKKGEEQLFFHAEKNQDARVKKDSLEWVGQDRHLIVVRDQMEKVEGDKHLTVTGDHNAKVNGSASLNVSMDYQHKVGQKHAVEAGTEIHLKSGMNIVIEGGVGITLKVGSNFIVIDPSGISMKGTLIQLNSAGAAGSGAGCNPETPKAPTEADTADPGEKGKPPPPKKPPTRSSFNAGGSAAASPGATGASGGSGGPPPASPPAEVLNQAAEDGTPFCEICEKMKQQQQQQ